MLLAIVSQAQSCRKGCCSSIRFSWYSAFQASNQSHESKMYASMDTMMIRTWIDDHVNRENQLTDHSNVRLEST